MWTAVTRFAQKLTNNIGVAVLPSARDTLTHAYTHDASTKPNQLQRGQEWFCCGIV
jgi:hypothetical protein